MRKFEMRYSFKKNDKSYFAVTNGTISDGVVKIYKPRLFQVDGFNVKKRPESSNPNTYAEAMRILGQISPGIEIVERPEPAPASITDAPNDEIEAATDETESPDLPTE